MCTVGPTEYNFLLTEDGRLNNSTHLTTGRQFFQRLKDRIIDLHSL